MAESVFYTCYWYLSHLLADNFPIFSLHAGVCFINTAKNEQIMKEKLAG